MILLMSKSLVSLMGQQDCKPCYAKDNNTLTLGVAGKEFDTDCPSGNILSISFNDLEWVGGKKSISNHPNRTMKYPISRRRDLRWVRGRAVEQQR